MGFYRSIKTDAADYCIIVDGKPMISAPNMANINNNFNSPVTIGNYITNCTGMFDGCYSFNQPVTIPSSVTNCYSMFYSCRSFNQPVTIPSSVTNCYSMFDSCSSFNQPVTIPSSVTDCSSMFVSCSSFNQPVTIPSSVTYCGYMFRRCTSLSRDINIKGTTYRSLTTRAMLMGKNNSKRVNVRFNSVLNNQFNLTNSSSLVGSTITWTAMTNGFYNEAYNVYCYYNYAG